MQLPEPVLAVLRNGGLTPQHWKDLRAALAASPILSGAELRGAIQKLQRAAAGITALQARLEAERAQLLTVEQNEPIPQTWDAFEEWWFRRMWAAWGHEGAVAFAKRIGLGRTTTYRKLAVWNIATPPPSPVIRRAAEVLAEVDELARQFPEPAGEGGDTCAK